MVVSVKMGIGIRCNYHGNGNDFMGMGGMGTVKVIPAHLYTQPFCGQFPG